MAASPAQRARLLQGRSLIRRRIRRRAARVLIACLVLLEAVLPQAATAAVAGAGGGVSFVICAVGEAKTISWTEMTARTDALGVTSPDEPDAGAPDGDRTRHCDACVAAPRLRAPPLSPAFYLPGVDLHQADGVEPDETVPADLHVSGPPLPSRAPPLKAAAA